MVRSGKTPLLNALARHRRLKTIPFHMPGHKKGKGIQPRFARLMKTDPFSLDMTEVPGLDDLHNPGGPIEEAQSRAAQLFGADRTFFLINGTTVGIHAAILAVCKQGDEILLPRDIHRSVIGACILAGARPRYLPARLNRDFFIPLPPKVEEVALGLQKYPAKAVFQVYPSYYGLAGDLAGVTRVAHNLKIPVIVDEAHGAHFKFSDRLPAPALHLGADICIQSTHKTLGALTQASMLHVRGRLVDRGEVARQLGILQTTSPSYLLMASLDSATGHMEFSGKSLVDETVGLANRVREEINSLPGIRCLGTEGSGDNGVFATDPTKMYISVRGTGLTGYQAADRLLKRYGIQVELGDRFNILCMFSIGNTSEDAGKLAAALREMAAVKPRSKAAETLLDFDTLPVPRQILTPREAWFARKRKVLLDDAIGEVAGEMVAPYPPGIPVLCPGEKVTHDIVELIRRFKAESCLFHGPADRTLSKLTVVDSVPAFGDPRSG